MKPNKQFIRETLQFEDLTPEEKETVFALRKAMNSMPVADVTEQILSLMTQTKNNKEFIVKIDSFIKKFK